jgi:DNA polymerase-3 subunit gamma/tau
MRDAESALDQLISFCGDKIEEPDVLSMFGLAAQSQLLELSRALLTGEVHAALILLNELAQHGKDLGRLLSDLLNHFRNLLIYQVSRGDLSLLEISEAEAASLKEQSALAGVEALTRIMEVLADAEIRLRDAASKKTLIEITLLKVIEARSALNLDAVLKQLQQLRGQSGAGVAPVPTPNLGGTRSTASPSSPEIKPGTGWNPSLPSPSVTTSQSAALTEAPAASGDLEGLWARLIEAVGRVSPFMRTYLVDAHPVSFAGNLFTIGFDPEFGDQIGLVDNPRNHTLLQTKLAELGHPNTQIKFVNADAPPGRVAPPAPAAQPSPAPQPAPAGAPAKAAASPPAKEKPAPASFSKEDFKNDPLIQKALEIFKGQIVEVRS